MLVSSVVQLSLQEFVFDPVSSNATMHGMCRWGEIVSAAGFWGWFLGSARIDDAGARRAETRSACLRRCTGDVSEAAVAPSLES
jgi:hypothetical protein